MFADLLPGLPFLIALYPEIHYRFRFFPFSRYYRQAPEIIADAPRRLEPGESLPLLFLIKCAHRFPLQLKAIEIIARAHDRVVRREISIHEVVQQPFWHRIERLELPDEAPAIWEVEVFWQVEIGGRGYRLRTDNLPGLSHGPLRVKQSGQALPRAEGWQLGDLHTHTIYTEDQVEFGAPLEAYPALGVAQGFSFAFAADHSYDLDDLPGSWMKCDPNLTRFHRRAKQIEYLNDQNRGRFTLLPGFELSVGNAKRRNVHLLLIGQRDFIPGSGDSAERWSRNQPEMSVSEVLRRCEDETLTVAAHPMVDPPLLEKLLLRRGSWEDDLAMGIPPNPPLIKGKNMELFGLQVWNGGQTRDFRAGIERWVGGLLKGKRWKIIAGSDAHGNFNRYRQVGFAMLKLTEKGDHVFGQAWTGVEAVKDSSEQEIISALRKNRSFISDGPCADLEIMERPGGWQVQVRAQSGSEFGGLARIVVYQGIPGEDQERLLIQDEKQGIFNWETIIPLETAEGYLRMEATTSYGNLCLTNPIFFNDRER
jgi:hypothetical protein